MCANTVMLLSGKMRTCLCCVLSLGSGYRSGLVQTAGVDSVRWPVEKV